MKYSIMITSLFGAKPDPVVDYYYTEDSVRSMYCDAILAAEASSKYILANHHIDEIVTLGSKTTYDPGDEMKQMVLREGSSFYSSDMRNLSTYSLLRYRLAQYIDEIRIEDQDIRDLLDEDEQKKVRDFCRAFYRDHVQPGSNIKYNRFFDALRSDEAKRDLFMKELADEIPAASEDPQRYRSWLLSYLYGELKDTYKLELLDGNEDVKIRFIPTDTDGNLSFAEKLVSGLHNMRRESDEEIEIELYVCILSEDAGDSFALMNLIEVVRSIPSSHMKISKIATACPMSSDDFVKAITDDTALYGISDLLAGTRAFLQYGKTDILMDYWKRQNIENTYIERLLYAMRNIDIGISLCDISDIERGINSLRSIFAEGDFVPGNNIVERYFDIIIDGIKEDYGVLVTGDEVNFIDLVKWAYRKGFWQQTLTLVESRAPGDFVDRGIFYYLDDEENRERVVKVFGQIYFNFKIFEKYKLDDVSHYFIKFYGRGRIDRAGNPEGSALQRMYTKARMSDLDTEDEEVIKACTNCTSKEKLSALLYAYYVLGYVRNFTNHAADTSNEFSRINDADVSERMNLIKQTLENFIAVYDSVLECMSDEPAPVLYVTTSEIHAYAQTLKPNYGRNYGDRGHGSKGYGGGGYHSRDKEDGNKEADGSFKKAND